jgi:hypothetical protein
MSLALQCEDCCTATTPIAVSVVPAHFIAQHVEEYEWM